MSARDGTPRQPLVSNKADEAIDSGSGVSLGTTSTTLASPNERRLALYVSDGHDTNVVWLKLDAAAAVGGEGILVGPGQTVKIEEYRGEVRGIATALSTPVGITEV